MKTKQRFFYLLLISLLLLTAAGCSQSSAALNDSVQADIGKSYHAAGRETGRGVILSFAGQKCHGQVIHISAAAKKLPIQAQYYKQDGVTYMVVDDYIQDADQISDYAHPATVHINLSAKNLTPGRHTLNLVTFAHDDLKDQVLNNHGITYQVD